MPNKRRVDWDIHRGLYELTVKRAKAEGRSQVSIVEQALAELLMIPLADPSFPEATAELCRQCERGVMSHGRCALCGWHRVQRKPWTPGKLRVREQQSSP